MVTANDNGNPLKWGIYVSYCISALMLLAPLPRAAFAAAVLCESIPSAARSSLRDTPIVSVKQDRAPSGRPFTVKITLPEGIEAGKKRVELCFVKKNNRIPADVISTIRKELDGKGEVWTITARVPKYERIFDGIAGE